MAVVEAGAHAKAWPALAKALVVKAPAAKVVSGSYLGIVGSLAVALGGSGVVALGALGAAAGSAVYGVVRARKTGRYIGR